MSDQEPLVDHEAQDDLAEALGDEFTELIGRFLDQLPSMLDRIAIAIAAGQCPAIASAAHTIKGAAINLGFLRLSVDAARLEKAAKAGDANVGDLMASLCATAATTIKTARPVA